MTRSNSDAGAERPEHIRAALRKLELLFREGHRFVADRRRVAVGAEVAAVRQDLLDPAVPLLQFRRELRERQHVRLLNGLSTLRVPQSLENGTPTIQPSISRDSQGLASGLEQRVHA